MNFKDQMRNSSKSYETSFTEKKRQAAENSAVSMYHTIKRTLLELASAGEYTICGSSKKTVLYVCDMHLNKCVKNYIVDYTMDCFHRELITQYITKSSFFRRVSIPSYTCRITPDDPTKWNLFIIRLKELCKSDSITIEPVIYDKSEQAEHSAHFPWECSAPALSENSFVVCLKCSIRY